MVRACAQEIPCYQINWNN